MNWADYTIRGATAPGGQKYISIINDDDNVTAWVPSRLFYYEAAKARVLLERQGLLVIGAAQVNALLEKVSHVNEFPARAIVSHVGFNGAEFALPDRTVYAPSGRDVSEAVFPAVEGACEQAGGLKSWKKGVAGPLAGQAIASFAIMTSFAGLVQGLTSRVENFGVEFVGPAACGKSTLLLAAASVIGGVGKDAAGRQTRALRDVLADLDEQLVANENTTLIIEGVDLWRASKSQQKAADAIGHMISTLSTGCRSAEALDERPISLIWVTSGTTSLVGNAAVGPALGKAAAGRLFTIPIGADREHGAFDRLPTGFASAGDLVVHLRAAATRNHGVAIRHFLQALVDARAADEHALVALIHRKMDTFLNRVGILARLGPARRAAEAFALVYAAGDLAKAYGVLPRSFKCMAAALKCYRLNQAEMQRLIPFLDRLKAVAAEPTTIVMDKAAQKQTPRGSIDNIHAFVLKRKHYDELAIRTADIEQVFPDWPERLKEDEVRALLQSESGRLAVKRGLCNDGERDRVYCFKLPPVVEQT